MENVKSDIAFEPQKLREAREKAFPGVSLRRVAKEVFGWNPQKLSAYELGTYVPDPNSLALMCDRYSVDLIANLTSKDLKIAA